MTATKRKSLDAALRALFQEREQAGACDHLVALLRSLPAQSAR